jgi:hypothetical protein
MSRNTLLGHLMLGLAPHPENAATEALAFILRQSQAATNALLSLIQSCGLTLPKSLLIETQQAEPQANSGIPDLRCVDAEGRKRIIVENKFWAGLTDNQPVNYLQELPSGADAALLFVVPEARRTNIWNELTELCHASSISLADTCQTLAITYAKLNPHHRLALTSWRILLAKLESAAADSSDGNTTADILQLKGLCEAVDTQAFLPLRLDEITNIETPRRIMNLADLTFEIVEACEKLGYWDRRGTKATHGPYSAGTYLRLGQFGAWVGLDAQLWRDFAISPLWVRFTGEEFGKPRVVSELLRAWKTTQPPRCFGWESDVVIPLILSPGLEKDKLIAACVKQVAELHKTLLESPAMAAGASSR